MQPTWVAPCLHRPLSAGSLQTWMHHPLGATDLACTGPEPVLHGLGCITPSDAFNHTLAPPSGYRFSRSPGALYVGQHEMIGIQAVVHPYFLQPNHFLFLFSSFFCCCCGMLLYPSHRRSSRCLEHDSTNAVRTLVTLAIHFGPCRNRAPTGSVIGRSHPILGTASLTNVRWHTRLRWGRLGLA